MPQCAYIIEKTGKRCKRQAEPGKKYCWQHETKVVTPSKVVKKSSSNLLYFSVLPSDLTIELLNYLDARTVREFTSPLFLSPELYTRLFPLNKLQVLYKKYIGTKLPDYDFADPNETIKAYLGDYVEYRA